MTVIGKKKEKGREGKGSEPLIGTIFSSGKGAINRAPKSETESETEGHICSVIIG